MESEAVTSLEVTEAVLAHRGTSELSPLWGVFPTFHFEKACSSLSRHWALGKTTVQACVQREGIMLWQWSNIVRQERKARAPVASSMQHIALAFSFTFWILLNTEL